MEECLALEVGVGEAVAEEGVVVDFLLVAHLSSTCLQISAHPCTPGQVSIPCCLQELWEVPEEEGLTLGLECRHNSSMDRVATHSTAHRYLVVEAPEGLHMAPCLPWEEEWVLA